MDWQNPTTYILVLIVAGGILSAGIWVGHIEYFKSDITATNESIDKNLENINSSLGILIEQRKFSSMPKESVKSGTEELTDRGRFILEKLDLSDNDLNYLASNRKLTASINPLVSTIDTADIVL